MPQSFSTQIKNFIDRHNLIDKDDRVVVGLSGGADSVALLTVLHELDYHCVAAHCNFHLRGEESMRDERFCREFCDRLGVTLITTDFDVDARRKDTGESTEMACRSLRYEWWRKIMDEGIGTILAVGHHREDNIETFFLNLLRGSGLAGLKGMLPKAGNVVRPLLDVNRQDITDYLAEKGIGYVIDSTNLLNDYKRNRLRNCVLPEFEKAFPEGLNGVLTSISHLHDNYSLYTDYADKLREMYVAPDGSINLKHIIASERNVRMVLFELIAKSGINMAQVDNIISSMTDKDVNRASGRIFKGTTVSYLLNRGYLLPIENCGTEEITTETIDIFSEPFSTFWLDTEDFIKMRNEGRLQSDAIYLDSRVLDGNPKFELRGWHKGDRMTPFGMKHGSRLVSDILSDAKYSLLDKQQVKLLTRDNEILWIIGLRTTDRFKVTHKTRKVIEITFKRPRNTINQL